MFASSVMLITLVNFLKVLNSHVVYKVKESLSRCVSVLQIVTEPFIVFKLDRFVADEDLPSVHWCRTRTEFDINKNLSYFRFRMLGH